MKKEEILELLRKTPVFWSRIGIGYDPPMKDDEGRWLLFSRDFEHFRRFHKQFYDAGVKLHSAVIPNGWLGIDEYDYTDVDNVLDSIMDIAEDFYFLPRVKLTPPISWCSENPEEVFVYDRGPRDSEGIKRTVNTLKQDILGYEEPGGYNANGGKIKDKRPNVGGIIGMQSFSSKKWQKDAGETLTRLIEHIRKKPYADRIIGFHIANGNCGESTIWGSWDKKVWRHGDYGISNTKRFAEYAENAIGIPAQIPSSDTMYGEKKSLLSYFREKDDISVLYSKYTSEINMEACEYFCLKVKEIDPDYVTGIFYGYILGQANCSHGGHLAIDRALESDAIDFIASPKGYYKYGPSGPGFEQAPCNSVNRKKLWIDEIDNLTHLHPYKDNPERATNFEETKTVLTREFAKNLTYNQGYWWMDLGDGCFDSEEIMQLIKTLNDVSTEVKKQESKDICEVLLVIDDESLHYTTPSFAYYESFIKDFSSNIKMCGAPVCLLRKSDLYEIDMSQYKTVVFLNLFKWDEQFAKVMSKIPKTTTLIWCYSAGIYNDKADKANITKLTGFTVTEYEGDLPEIPNTSGMPIDFPPILIEEAEGTKAIKRYQNGEIVIAENSYGDRRNIMLGLPILTIDEIYDILKEADVKLWGTKHSTVYANSLFRSFYANEDISFTCEVGDGEGLLDIFTGERYTKAFELDMKKGTCRFFRVV